MSCTIYIETERNQTNRKLWDLIWSISGADWNADETYRQIECSDRMKAAIYNLGYACKCLADNEVVFGTIEIKSDQDGKDYRYDSEHDALYALVCPLDDIQARKYRSLYHRYTRYIGRIQTLQYKWKITIELSQ